MDKLAQRAGVSALVLVASAGAALAFGMYRMALSLDPATLKDEGPAAAAMLKLPEVSRPQTPAEPVKEPAVAPPPAEVNQAVKPAPNLASAFGAALGAHPKPRAVPVAARAEPREAPPASASDDLDLELGFKTEARDTSFNERGARAFAVHQRGGAEQQRKTDKSPGERLSFETDLGDPR